MKQRVVSVVLAAALLFALFGCAGSETQEKEPGPDTSAVTQEQKPAADTQEDDPAGEEPAGETQSDFRGGSTGQTTTGTKSSGLGEKRPTSDPGGPSGLSSTAAATGKYAFLGNRSDLTTYYVTAVGEMQGAIHGGCRSSGARRDTIVACGYSAGGYAADHGNRALYKSVSQHLASLTIRMDAAVPQLMKAASNGEKLQLGIVKYKVISSGEEVPHFSADYTGAVIVGVESVRSAGGYYEKLWFTFSEVTYTDCVSGKSWHGSTDEVVGILSEDSDEPGAEMTYANNYTAHTFLSVSGSTQGVIAGTREYTAGKSWEYPQPENSLLLHGYGIGGAVSAKASNGYDQSASTVATFIHKADRATPKLQRAASTGEKLTFRVTQTEMDSLGYEVPYLTAVYSDAVIVGDELFTDSATGHLMERITVTFGEAAYRDEINGTEWSVRGFREDNWGNSAVVGYGVDQLGRCQEYPMFVRIIGSRQGEIRGDCARNDGYAGTVMAYAYSAGIKATYDAEARSYGEMKQQLASFVHKADQATPGLQQAAATGEELELTLTREQANGKLIAAYTGAMINDIELFTDEGTGILLEKVTFSFRTVSYQSTADGSSWTTDWTW